MTKEECQEQVAKVICDKSDEITCDECFRLSNGHICEGLDHCRISEKTEEQLKYVLSSAKKDTFLRACAGSGKTEVVGMKADRKSTRLNSSHEVPSRMPSSA